MDAGSSPRAPDEVDEARAAEYALLARLLATAPDHDLLAALARLTGDGTPLGLARSRLAAAASATNARAVEQEYFDLFVGLGRGELLPYASFYLTGFLHERPLARVREDLSALGVERGRAVRSLGGRRGALFRTPPRALGRAVLRGSADGAIGPFLRRGRRLRARLPRD
jgi:hypothetical protein